MGYARLERRRAGMSADFELWAMRGMIVTMGAIIGAFVWREIRGKDDLWKTIHKNRETHEQALKEAQASFARALERVTSQFRTSIESLNTAIASLSTTVAKLDSTMAREYATKDDLRETRAELRAELASHAENCPAKFGGR